MSLISVNSSSIRAVGFDGHNLAVLFHSSDTLYVHPGVPESVFYEFLNAPSMGQYYNRFIRSRYR
jgi:hypothetical protein